MTAINTGTDDGISRSSVGIIGVGNLGAAMAEQLLAAKWTVAVADANRDAVDRLAGKGAIACTTPADVARLADIVFLVVRTAQDVEDVVFGPAGIAEGKDAATLIGIVATISLDDLHRIHQRGAAQALDIIDVTIGGGSALVAEQRAAAMIGGSEEQFDRVSVPFGVFCGDMIHVPGIGGGMRLKLIKNYVSYTAMMISMEAARLARAAEIDLPLVTRAIRSSDLVKQFLHFYLEGADFDPLAGNAPAETLSAQKAMADLCRKDLSAAQALAASKGVDLPVAGTVAGRADELFRLPRVPSPDAGKPIRADDASTGMDGAVSQDGALHAR